MIYHTSERRLRGKRWENGISVNPYVVMNYWISGKTGFGFPKNKSICCKELFAIWENGENILN